MASPVVGEAPLSVNFADISTSSPDTWLWEFGDGFTTTSHNPTHIYTISGAYTVKLTASKGAISDTEIKTDYIVVLVNYPTLVTEDYAVSPERSDVRTMHASSVGNYLFIKKGIRIILKSQDTGDSGFIRPNGPTIVFD
jgi:PKD repeat protein